MDYGRELKSFPAWNVKLAFLRPLALELALVGGASTKGPLKGFHVALMFPCWGTKPSKIFQQRIIR